MSTVSVDRSAAVLVSDILALQEADDQTLFDAKAYTDHQDPDAGADPVHTHTASQITDFSDSVSAVVGALPALSFTRGMVVMYSGLLSDIGVGALAGWALCDGSNGTPNLRDKFVMGAGNAVVGKTNPATSAPTSQNGDHIHVIAGTPLTIAQIPSHASPAPATVLATAQSATW